MPRRAHKVAICCMLALSLSALYVSCANKENGGGGDLGMSIYGFVLGETKKEMLERAGSELEWQKLEGDSWDYRGELYYLPRSLDGSDGVDHLRLAFFDGLLFEIVAYYEDTSPAKLEELKVELEKRFGGKMQAPGGVAETYRLPGREISVTLSRLAKPGCAEISAQFIHNELHGRLIKEKLDMKSDL